MLIATQLAKLDTFARRNFARAFVREDFCKMRICKRKEDFFGVTVASFFKGLFKVAFVMRL